MNVPKPLNPLKGIVSISIEKLKKEESETIPLSGLFYCELCEKEFKRETKYVKELSMYACKNCRKKRGYE